YHDRSVYDTINGVLDRSRAYTYAGNNVVKILKKYPSIEVVIDLHRDAVGGNKKLVTTINGKKTAQIMFFNGLSRTAKNGDIGYLQNPNKESNLAFSLQMQLEAAKQFPGFTRKIYLKGYRYNLHLKPRSMLIEAGAQTNTVQEVKNAMEPLAKLLYTVLKGK
ncbi:MAG: stage II sporulation protein P, partial [Lachnospiraceae bacterium]|nr:stage II sporulation protein P [Lachnospiraceae bacterium]